MHRFRLSYTKENELKYISHLELQRTFVRAFRRAGLSLAYSSGYNPHPRVVFAAPLAVGIEGKNEFLDFFLQHNPEEQKIMELLSEQLPAGLKIKNINEVEFHSPPLSAMVEASLYVVFLERVPQELSHSLETLLAAEELKVERKGKKGVKVINLRPFIRKLLLQQRAGREALVMLLTSGNQGGARPDEVIALLDLSPQFIEKICREVVLLPGNGTLVTPDGRKVDEFLAS